MERKCENCTHDEVCGFRNTVSAEECVFFSGGYVHLKKKFEKKKVELWNGQTACPRCGRLFGNSKDISSIYKHRNSCCRYCGQALDWGEEFDGESEGKK